MEIHIDKYRVTPEKVFAGTEGSYGQETIEFVFSHEWEHLAKTITFYPPRTAPIAVVISGDSIGIPWEITQRCGTVRFVIEGCEEGRVLRTVPSDLVVVPTEKAQGITGTEPTQDEYQQIYELMQDTLEAVEAVNFEMIEVETLPPSGEPNKIYVIDTGLAPPYRFAEYIYFDGAWELFGTPSEFQDLSSYARKDELSDVAFSGSYNDLTDKPAFAQVNADWNATSGAAEILNKPTIPAAQVNSDWNAESGVAQILNKPSIPTKTSQLTNDGSDNTSTYLEADETAYKTASIPYAQVDGTSTSTAFTATVPGITQLRDGVMMLLKNGVVTSASGFTINVNNLGAKPSYNNMAAATADTTLFNVNYTMLFIYDETRVSGGCWICYRGYNSDTNTIGYQLRTNSTVLTASDRSRYYKIFFTSADGTKWVPASSDWTNNATSARAVNQRPIDPFGRIAYTSASTNYTAGSNVAAATLWSQYNLTLGYSFNRTGAALTLTANAPLYIKCAPQSDGSAIIDSATPYVQALPTTDDGKIYIFLGIATSATQVEMYVCHPVYYYAGGRIRLWTGARDPQGSNVFVGTNTIDEVYSSFVTGVPTYIFRNNKMYLVNDVSYMTGTYADRFQISALSSSFGGVSDISLHAIIDKEIPTGTLCSSLATLTKTIS